MNNLIKLAAIGIISLTALPAQAETLNNRRGFTYENAKILVVEKDRVSLSHDSGLGWVKFDDLTPESIKWITSQKIYIDFNDREAKKEEAARRLLAQQEAAARELLAKQAAEAKALKEQTEQTRLQLETWQKERKEEEEKTRKEKRQAAEIALETEFKRLAKIERLWVTDFNSIKRIMGDEKFFDHNRSAFVIEALGKPDREYNYTIPHWEVRDLEIPIQEITYNNRVFNPTTEKFENLTIQFMRSFYQQAIAPESGNKSQ